MMPGCTSRPVALTGFEPRTCCFFAVHYNTLQNIGANAASETHSPRGTKATVWVRGVVG